MHFNELHKIMERRYSVFRKKATLGVGVSITVSWPNEQHEAESLITVSLPFKEFPTFYGNRRFISVQSLLTDLSKIRFNIMLPFMLRSSEWVSFPQVSPPKPCYL
jgi:hypothetical protein